MIRLSQRLDHQTGASHTGLYHVDCDKFTLDLDAFPAGAVDVLADRDTLWLASSDDLVYRGSIQGDNPKARFVRAP